MPDRNATSRAQWTRTSAGICRYDLKFAVSLAPEPLAKREQPLKHSKKDLQSEFDISITYDINNAASLYMMLAVEGVLNERLVFGRF
jgi:hypothetical protein